MSMRTVADFDYRVEVSFDDPTVDSPSWEDVSSRLVGIDGDALRIRTGRGDEFSRVDPATGRITLRNTDGYLGPDVDAVPPWCHLRVLIDRQEGDGWEPMWRGYVERWSHPRVDPGRRWVEAHLTDAVAWLAYAGVRIERGWELSGERIRHVLDEAGWPSSLTDVDDGVVEVEPVDEERGAERAGRLIEEAVEGEAGNLWVDPDGTIRFAGRHARLAMNTSATVDDRWQADTTGHLDDQQLMTVIRHEDAAGREVEVVDSDGVSRYGRRVWDARDLLVRRVEVEALGQWMLFRYSSPTERFDPIRVQPLVGEDAAAFAVGVRIGDLVAIEREWPTGGSDPSEGVVEGVEHRLSGSRWQTRLTVSPYFGDQEWAMVADDQDEPDDAPELDDGLLAP